MLGARIATIVIAVTLMAPWPRSAAIRRAPLADLIEVISNFTHGSVTRSQSVQFSTGSCSRLVSDALTESDFGEAWWLRVR